MLYADIDVTFTVLVNRHPSLHISLNISTSLLTTCPILSLCLILNSTRNIDFCPLFHVLDQLFSAAVKCFESRLRLPSSFCAALSSLSREPLIFCVTDFVLL